MEARRFAYCTAANARKASNRTKDDDRSKTPSTDKRHDRSFLQHVASRQRLQEGRLARTEGDETRIVRSTQHQQARVARSQLYDFVRRAGLGGCPDAIDRIDGAE
jgi:hypothetical protein